MAATYRFSLLRAEGWARLGFAGAVAVLFGTPMLWALGVFGADQPAMIHAVIFMFAGVFLTLGLGYAIGWAVRGFTVRLKDAADEDEAAHRPALGHAGPAHPTAGHAAPPHGSAPHPAGTPARPPGR